MPAMNSTVTMMVTITVGSALDHVTEYRCTLVQRYPGVTFVRCELGNRMPGHTIIKLATAGTVELS